MDKRSYGDWVTFNNAHRGHQNYLEFLPAKIVLILLTGLFDPMLAASLGMLMIVAREFYSKLYLLGAGYRLVPAIVVDLILVVLLVISAYNLIPMMLGVFIGK